MQNALSNRSLNNSYYQCIKVLLSHVYANDCQSLKGNAANFTN